MTGDDAYQPLDLSAYRGTSVALLEHDARAAAVGFQQFHGLPFAIGEGDTAFIGLGEGLSSEPVSIPVGRTVFSVLFAHRLVGSRIPQGGPVGTMCAEYVFTLGDGSHHSVPIRERFEIADIAPWGNMPFLALPDEAHRLQSRWRGLWGHAGFRQTESS
jgi:hypothetical protein